MRGFLSGVIWGIVVMGVGVAAMSLMSPVGPRPDVLSDAPRTDDAPQQEETTDADVTPAPETAPVAPPAQVPTVTPPQAAAPVPGTPVPAQQPDVGGQPSELEQPASGAGDAGVTIDADAPVSATASSPAPAIPQAASDVPQPSDDPAQPALPDLGDAASGFAPAASQSELPPDIAVGSDPAPDDTGGDPITQPRSETAPQADAATPDAMTPLDSAESARPQIAALPQTGTDGAVPRNQVGTRVVPLTERDDPTPTADIADPETDERPLWRYASIFENPDNKPLMAIVLIDDAAAIGTEALEGFPYPLTFAVDPTAPDAAAKMAGHRAAGFEVMALVDLPRQANAQDAEVALAAGFNTLDQAIGMLEGTGSGIQGNRDLSDQVTAFVGDTGRGMITQNVGLNTVQKLAARDGVPAAVVFRDFDSAGQTPDEMRRFLDQAAFRAGQEGAVIMLGRVRPDTISALLLWGLQDRAARVALAPASAILIGEQLPQ